MPILRQRGSPRQLGCLWPADWTGHSGHPQHLVASPSQHAHFDSLAAHLCDSERHDTCLPRFCVSCWATPSVPSVNSRTRQQPSNWAASESPVHQRPTYSPRPDQALPTDPEIWRPRKSDAPSKTARTSRSVSRATAASATATSAASTGCWRTTSAPAWTTSVTNYDGFLFPSEVVG